MRAFAYKRKASLTFVMYVWLYTLNGNSHSCRISVKFLCTMYLIILPTNIILDKSRDVVQRLLALLNQQWCCSSGLKWFQCPLAIGAYTNIFLRSIQWLNFIDTCQDGINLGLEDCYPSAQGEVEPSSYRLPVDANPGPLSHLGPIGKTDEPFDSRRGAWAFSPILPVR